MIKINLVDKLHKIAERNLISSQREADEILSSVKENLSIEDQKDASMLNYFGTSKVVSDAVGKNDDLKRRAEALTAKGAALSIKDIKRVCIHYNLRLLPATFYKKEIPAVVLNDLRRFMEGRTQHSGELYVIAPYTHFKLGPRPAKDPILIWKDDKTGNYQVISKWGKDFTIFRRLLGIWKYSVPLSALCIMIAIGSPLIAVLVPDVLEGVLSCVLLLVMSILFSAVAFEDTDSISECWNSPTE